MKDVEIYVYIGLYNIINNKIEILLKDNELLNEKMNSIENIDVFASKVLKKYIDISNLSLTQCHTYTKKNNNKLIIDILYIGIINDSVKMLDYNCKFIDDIEYKYKEELLKYLRIEINKIDILKTLYKEFSLPELQYLLENIFSIKIDRRNFRKRLIKLNVIEDLNKISNSKKGRPSKLYKFKDNIKLKILFEEVI